MDQQTCAQLCSFSPHIKFNQRIKELIVSDLLPTPIVIVFPVILSIPTINTILKNQHNLNIFRENFPSNLHLPD